MLGNFQASTCLLREREQMFIIEDRKVTEQNRKKVTSARS